MALLSTAQQHNSTTAGCTEHLFLINVCNDVDTAGLHTTPVDYLTTFHLDPLLSVPFISLSLPLKGIFHTQYWEIIIHNPDMNQFGLDIINLDSISPPEHKTMCLAWSWYLWMKIFMADKWLLVFADRVSQGWPGLAPILQETAQTVINQAHASCCSRHHRPRAWAKIDLNN